MRKAVMVLALLILFGGESFGAGWPFWPSALSHHRAQRPCASCAGGGYYGDSPLYPELAPWTFEQSQCKQPWCSGHGGSGEVPYFPPLPYGHRPFVSTGQPTAFGAP